MSSTYFCQFKPFATAGMTIDEVGEIIKFIVNAPETFGVISRSFALQPAVEKVESLVMNHVAVKA